MSLADDINKYRKQIMGEQATEDDKADDKTEAETKETQEQPSKLRQMLAARKEKTGESDAPPETQEEKEEEEKEVVDEKNEMSETTENTQEPENEPTEKELLIEILALLKTKQAPQETTQETDESEQTQESSETQETQETDESEAPQMSENAEETQETTQETDDKKKETAPSEPTAEERAMWARGRAALDRNTNSRITASLKDVLAEECKRLKIPEENWDLISHAVFSKRGQDLTPENAGEILREESKNYPIISRGTQIPAVAGGNKPSAAVDTSELSLNERKRLAVQHAGKP